MENVHSSKFEVEKLNGKNSFVLWNLKMQDMLMQQGLQKVFVGNTKKPASMIGEEWEDLYTRAPNSIRLCLAEEVLFNIVEEETKLGLWNILDIFYIAKSLTNKIFFKRNLYILQMK